MKTLRIAPRLLKEQIDHSLPPKPPKPPSELIFRMFGRTLRIEPATGTRKEPGSFRERRDFGGDGEGSRPRREGGFRSREDRGEYQRGGGFREFSTFRAAGMGVSGLMGVRRPVQLTQVNALVGRRMFGLAASVLSRRRLV